MSCSSGTAVWTVQRRSPVPKSCALRHTHGDVLGEESRARVAHAASAAAVRLGHGGVDIAGHMVAEVLADVDDARVALGCIDLLSESYGTRLALLYAQAHPERVARSVLLGVNPPGRFVWDPAIVDAQLDDWATLWAASGDGDRHREAFSVDYDADRDYRRWLDPPDAVLGSPLSLLSSPADRTGRPQPSQTSYGTYARAGSGRCS